MALGTLLLSLLSSLSHFPQLKPSAQIIQKQKNPHYNIHPCGATGSSAGSSAGTLECVVVAVTSAAKHMNSSFLFCISILSWVAPNKTVLFRCRTGVFLIQKNGRGYCLSRSFMNLLAADDSQHFADILHGLGQVLHHLHIVFPPELRCGLFLTGCRCRRPVRRWTAWSWQNSSS